MIVVVFTVYGFCFSGVEGLWFSTSFVTAVPFFLQQQYQIQTQKPMQLQILIMIAAMRSPAIVFTTSVISSLYSNSYGVLDLEVSQVEEPVDGISVL